MTFVIYCKNTKKVRDNLKANIKRYKGLVDAAYDDIEKFRERIVERDTDLKYYLEIVEAMEDDLKILEQQAKEKKDGKA